MFELSCCLVSLIQAVLAAGILGFLLLFLVVKFTTTSPFPTIDTEHDQEKVFKSSSGENATEPFPSLEDSGSLELSVIVPAYNEETRLPVMLDECLAFLEGRKKSYEVIIVDDGSKDVTTEVAQGYVTKYSSEKVRVLKLVQNKGKGGAVRMGMLRARGRTLLFADADGATKFADIVKLEEELQKIKSPDNFGIVCGSRAHLEEESVATRTLFRTILMYGFHCCVWVFAVKKIRDTQCGFKLLTRPAARIVFRALHIERWAFDVEMLKIAEMLSIPVSEVAVRWTEIDGSKLNPVSAAIEMFRDIFLLWLRYAVGAWRLPEKMD